MKAIYQGKLYQMGDNLNEAELIDEDVDGVHGTIVVPYGDPELIIDPTDDDIRVFVDGYVPKPVALDQIVGCNVHGRLTHILDLVTRAKNTEAVDEINALLKFFA